MNSGNFKKLTSKYLFKFFEKKNLPYEQWEININGSKHYIDNQQVIDMILSAQPEDQELIVESLRELDAKGKDINLFLRNLAMESFSIQ
ncbi:MAG TPA: hypothetical protein VIQ03_06185 [Gammaproteobacteria bacterium]